MSTKIFIKTSDIIHAELWKMHQKFSALILLIMGILGVSSASLTSGIIFGSKTMSNQGTIRAIGVGVYQDRWCLNEVTSVDWGVIDPGSSLEFIVYIKNQGNAPMKLSMTVDEWSPSSASDFISLTWDVEDAQVDMGEALRTTLTLSVSPQIEGITSFSFDVTITGA